MWTFVRKTGELFRPDKSLAVVGYSGIAEGLNNPALEAMKNLGPIPDGLWNIGESFRHQQTGPITMRLMPQEGTETFGRDGFLIHGDNSALNHTASHGCIIIPKVIRLELADSRDRILEVI